MPGFSKRIREWASGVLDLIGFLTLLPVGGRSLRGAANWFHQAPLVGVVKGLICAWPIPLEPVLGPSVTAALILVSHALVQGFLDIDGFMDFGEALLAWLGGRDPMKILKDTHKGSYAVALCCLHAVLGYATLSSITVLEPWIGAWSIVCLLVIAETLSAESMFIVCRLGRRPPYEGMGRLFIDASRTPWSMPANIIVLTPVLAVLAYHVGITCLALSLLACVSSSLVSLALALRSLGFVQGDVLGFSNELAWLSILVVCSACVV